MVTAFKTFISIGKAIAGVLVNAFSAGAGPINKFLKWIRDAIKGFGNFLKSAKGKNDVSKFFKDTLPFVKSLLSFVGKVIKIIAQLLQFFLPIFKPVLDGFNSLLDIFSAVLGFVDKLIEPFKTLIGYFLSLFVGMGPLGKAVGAVTKIFERFGGGIKGILGAFKGFAGKVKNSLFKPFADAWGEVRKLFQTIGGRLGSAALKIMDGIEKVLKTVFHIITTPYRLAWDAVTAIFAKIKGPLVKAAKAIWDGIKGAFQGVKGFFSRIFGTVIDVIKGTLNGVIGVINIALKGINKITPSARHIGPLKIPGIPDIPLIPKLAAGGITRGATSAFIGEAGPEAVIPLSKSILREIGFGIAAAMNGQIVQGRRLSPAGAGGGGGGMRQIFEKVEVHMSAPGGGVPDPRAAAVMFSRELSRRGG
jgi:phage-related protein